MTYKQIEASREVRLWIGQIIVPAITIAVSTLAIPEVRQAVAAKARDVKQNIARKIKRYKTEGLGYKNSALSFFYALITITIMKETSIFFKRRNTYEICKS